MIIAAAFTTQVNSAFQPRWLVNSEVIIEVIFTSLSVNFKIAKD